MTTTIEVIAIEPPAEGKKMGKVITETGATLQVWPNMMSQLRVGHRYAVTLKENEFNGRTYSTITRIHGAGEGKAARPAAPSPIPRGDGTPGDEATFVASILGSFIRAGQLTLNPDDWDHSKRQIAQTTMMLRGLWNYAFVANGRNTAGTSH
jgi:hypothetical protein